MPSGEPAWHYVETHRGSDHLRVPNFAYGYGTFQRTIAHYSRHCKQSQCQPSLGRFRPEPGRLLTNELSYRNPPARALPFGAQSLTFLDSSIR